MPVSDVTAALTALHTGAIDALGGYEEAVKDAGPSDHAALFRTMRALHAQIAGELAAMLRNRGAQIDDDGSLLKTVHETIIKLRSAIGGLGHGVLPGLIDGEERNLAAFDQVLARPDLQREERALLMRQKSRITAQIFEMKRLV